MLADNQIIIADFQIIPLDALSVFADIQIMPHDIQIISADIHVLPHDGRVSPLDFHFLNFSKDKIFSIPFFFLLLHRNIIILNRIPLVIKKPNKVRQFIKTKKI